MEAEVTPQAVRIACNVAQQCGLEIAPIGHLLQAAHDRLLHKLSVVDSQMVPRLVAPVLEPLERVVDLGRCVRPSEQCESLMMVSRVLFHTRQIGFDALQRAIECSRHHPLELARSRVTAEGKRDITIAPRLCQVRLDIRHAAW